MSGILMRSLDLAQHRGVFRLGHGDAHHLAARFLEPMNLGDGRVDVVGIGRGHRLHDDRVVAADDEIADPTSRVLWRVNACLYTDRTPRDV